MQAHEVLAIVLGHFLQNGGSVLLCIAKLTLNAGTWPMYLCFYHVSHFTTELMLNSLSCPRTLTVKI